MSAVTQLRTERASIDEVLGTLDELAQATRAHDLDAYIIALELAASQPLSNDQIRDAYDWGNRTATTLGAIRLDRVDPAMSDNSPESTTTRARRSSQRLSGCDHSSPHRQIRHLPRVECRSNASEAAL